MKELRQGELSEPFFITEKVEAGLVVTGYELEPPPIACTGRLSDVLERMTDAELALQPGEIAERQRELRQNRQSLA